MGLRARDRLGKCRRVECELGEPTGNRAGIRVLKHQHRRRIPRAWATVIWLMNPSLHIGDLIGGGMLMLSSAFALIITWKRKERVSTTTYQQLIRMYAGGIIAGAAIA